MKILTLLTAIAIAPIALAHPDHFPPDHPDHPSDHPEQPSDHPEHPSDHPEHPSDHPEHPSDHPEHPSDHPEHPAKKAEVSADTAAKAILEKVSEKYKKANGIKETITVSLPPMMGGDYRFTFKRYSRLTFTKR
ncbi:MAG TPA: hypothetical protein EYO31_02815 [Phycisphaerales bacterium]|nr:hypothetical protein [Phycisphaerales bacterium]